MMERIDTPIHTEDLVEAPLEPSGGRLREGFFDEIARTTRGLVRAERWQFRLGPITLFRFDPPRASEGGWWWPIAGGLLVGRPGGTLAVAWRDGNLVSTLDGYHPRLPQWLYRLTQLPLHLAVTRQALLQVRGRDPSPGVPAGPAERAVAAGIDLSLCAGLALLARRRRLLAFAALATAYHVGLWATRGGTVGARMLNLRLVAVDGSPPSPVQAVLRLLSLPLGVKRLRAVHDEVAATVLISLPRKWRAG